MQLLYHIRYREAGLDLLPTNKDFYSFHTWCMDLITNKKPPDMEGEKYVLLAVDDFSKWIEILDPGKS